MRQGGDLRKVDLREDRNFKDPYRDSRLVSGSVCTLNRKGGIEGKTENKLVGSLNKRK